MTVFDWLLPTMRNENGSALQKIKVVGANIRILADLLGFLWRRRLWWLLPLVVLLALLMLLLIIAQSSGFAPFLYPL